MCVCFTITFFTLCERVYVVSVAYYVYGCVTMCILSLTHRWFLVTVWSPVALRTVLSVTDTSLPLPSNLLTTAAASSLHPTLPASLPLSSSVTLSLLSVLPLSRHKSHLWSSANTSALELISILSLPSHNFLFLTVSRHKCVINPQ